MSPPKSFHGKSWKDYVDRRVTPRFKKFGELTRTRVMRGFEDIDREATELEARRRKELIESLDV